MAGKEKKRKLVLLAVPIWKESKVYNKKGNRLREGRR